MKEYIILIAMAAVITAVTEILAPEKWRGYIRVVTGFLVLAVLISPVKKIKNTDIFIPQEKFEASETTVLDVVAKELCHNVERDIEDRILTEYGKEAEATCQIDLNEEHKIKGVKRITIRIKKVPDGLLNRLKEIYGCENIEFRPE